MAESESHGTTHRIMARKRIRIICIAAGVFIVVAALVLWRLPEMLLSNWFPDLSSQERAPFLGPAAQVVLFSLGGVIAIVGVGLSIARHAEELLAAELDQERAALERDRNALSINAHQFERDVERHRREEAVVNRDAGTAREFRARFVTSVEMLTVTGAIKRTAGLYALAALADDWIGFQRREEAQVCINVLCGYLRSPLTSRDGEADTDEAAVRRSGYSIIQSRLATVDEPKVAAWSGFRFDLRDAPITFQASLNQVTIGLDTLIDLSGAEISADRTSFHQIRLTQNGELRIDHARLSGSAGLQISGGHLSETASISLDGTTLSGTAQLQLAGLTLSNDARIELTLGAVSDRASVALRIKQLDSSSVHVEGSYSDQTLLSVRAARIRDRSYLDLGDVEISGEARLRLSSSGVSGEGSILLHRAALRFSGLEFDHDARPNTRGMILARGTTSIADGKAFGTSAFIDREGITEAIVELSDVVAD